jgi:hypothetical protein
MLKWPDFNEKTCSKAYMKGRYIVDHYYFQRAFSQKNLRNKTIFPEATRPLYWAGYSDFLKLTVPQVFLDWEKIFKTILEQVFPLF